MQSGITVDRPHTDEMISRETVAMLDDSPIRLTMGAAVRLFQVKSPFIMGGTVTSGDLETACIILKIPLDELPEEWGAPELSAAISEAVEDAWRVWELIQPDGKGAEAPDYHDFDPEWIADVVAAAASALPSLTWHGALEEMPLCALLHLVCSGIRRTGGKVHRPTGVMEALKRLKEMKK